MQNNSTPTQHQTNEEFMSTNHPQKKVMGGDIEAVVQSVWNATTFDVLLVEDEALERVNPDGSYFDSFYLRDGFLTKSVYDEIKTGLTGLFKKIDADLTLFDEDALIAKYEPEILDFWNAYGFLCEPNMRGYLDPGQGHAFIIDETHAVLHALARTGFTDYLKNEQENTAKNHAPDLGGKLENSVQKKEEDKTYEDNGPETLEHLIKKAEGSPHNDVLIADFVVDDVFCFDDDPDADFVILKRADEPQEEKSYMMLCAHEGYRDRTHQVFTDFMQAMRNDKADKRAFYYIKGFVALSELFDDLGDLLYNSNDGAINMLNYGEGYVGKLINYFEQVAKHFANRTDSEEIDLVHTVLINAYYRQALSVSGLARDLLSSKDLRYLAELKDVHEQEDKRRKTRAKKLL